MAGFPEIPMVQARGGPIGNTNEVSISQLLDAAFCDDWGAVIYRDYDTWKCLDPGTPGDFLTTQGPGAPPIWSPGSTTLTPSFSAFSISGQTTPLEVGATISAGSKTFLWTTVNPSVVQPNSIGITDTTAGTPLATGLADDGSQAITISAITNILPASNIWTITGTKTAGGTFSRTYTVNWLWRVYAGENAAATLTANQIKALSASSSLQASFPGTYTIVPSSSYSYFCFPTSMGDPLYFRDGNTMFPISMATAADNAAYSNVGTNGWAYALVSVTNAQSVATNYRVYRTQYSFSGTLSMVVT